MGRPARVTAPLLAATAIAVAAGCGGARSEVVDTTPVRAGDPVAGKAVYLGSSGCGGCHTLADAGSESSVASNLDETRPTAALVREVVANGKDAMPPYGKQLSAQEIADLAAYVASVAGS